MPFAGIRLLFETLVQCTRMMCKCEMREIGSKDCNPITGEIREPSEIAYLKICCTAKFPVPVRRCWTARAALP